ncbi:immunoglobulin-like domain-containing receptor 2 isoform X2 [Xyrauchen texanus]|uniref:immunoglobulin-like domain-containing receptor 2 isoform X2 n=1 Tax=Xyrauchen texanus TaxID=154827 RepID=UPI002241F0A4|nr:immunoglobulin-like domain-containing receptor 2 isoform X2 [Xyrauchen texanus]
MNSSQTRDRVKADRAPPLQSRYTPTQHSTRHRRNITMKRKTPNKHAADSPTDQKTDGFNVISLFRCWISLMAFTDVWWCDAVQVSVRDDRRFAMLFQSVRLPCQYTSISSQTPVIQWWYKSYCRDHTRDALRFPNTLPLQGSELGSSGHLDCGDSGRTVRIVASGQGSSITLAEHYKGRDISIINKADLRIGELQWGDSGVYVCKVIISDDLEGQNEAHVQLLVLEWVFVASVAVGSILFIVLVSVCWCQCCPHSCCCYVRCCCCPDTCCCPRHLYEAGKGLKSTPPTPVPMYPSYYIPGMPTMVPIVPPSLIDPHLSTAPSVDNNITPVRSGFHLKSVSEQSQSTLKVLQYVENQLAHFNPSQTLSSKHDSCSMSELSSLHDAENDFHQMYQQVQKKALPAIPDLDDPPDLLTTDLSAAHDGRGIRQPHHRNRVADENPRWNPRSEHLQRKAFQDRGRTGSLDELEEFAMTYMQRGRHDFDNRGDNYRGHEQERARERERECELERDCYPFPCSKRYSPKDSPVQRPPKPPPVPGKCRDTWESDQPQRDPRDRVQIERRDYDDALLNSLLERKSKAVKSISSKAGRTEEDSNMPSRNSSKKSSEHFSSRSPSNPSPHQRTAEENESLPSYTERQTERSCATESGQRPFNYTRSSHGSSPNAQESREEPNHPRKVVLCLCRSLCLNWRNARLCLHRSYYAAIIRHQLNSRMSSSPGNSNPSAKIRFWNITPQRISLHFSWVKILPMTVWIRSELSEPSLRNWDPTRPFWVPSTENVKSPSRTRRIWSSMRSCGGIMGCISALLRHLETQLEIQIKR